MIVRWLTWIAGLVLVGCSSLAEPNATTVLGTITGFNQDDPRIGVATAGRAVTITVTTYGNGCYSQGPTQSHTTGMTVSITPYDRVAGRVCTDILQSFVHAATVEFPAAGSVLIRVRGRDIAGDTVAFERTVSLP
jgi:hypothetical protein